LASQTNTGLLIGSQPAFRAASSAAPLLSFSTFASGMAESVTLHPQTVEYDPVTGVPTEFNDFLPKDSEEYKK